MRNTDEAAAPSAVPRLRWRTLSHARAADTPADAPTTPRAAGSRAAGGEGWSNAAASILNGGEAGPAAAAILAAALAA
eukprot:scaffold26647_cov115-Isochrysis_galbana.AAC.3